MSIIFNYLTHWFWYLNLVIKYDEKGEITVSNEMLHEFAEMLYERFTDIRQTAEWKNYYREYLENLGLTEELPKAE